MELMLAVISRLILVGYYFILLMMASRQIQVRLLPNSKYVIYCNYVNEKNRCQYEDNIHYYKSIAKGVLIQLMGVLWVSVIVHHLWFIIISLIAAFCVLLESVLVNWIFPKNMRWKDWIILYMKRVAGMISDGYLVIALVALCFIY